MVDSYKPEMLSLKDAIKNVTGRILNDDDLKKLTSLTTDEFFKSLNFNSEEISIINKELEEENACNTPELISEKINCMLMVR